MEAVIRMTTKRTDLAKKNGKRQTFKGTFQRIGKKHGKQSGPTALLVDIKDKRGKIVTDHLWVNYTKGLAQLNSLFPGDVIEFDARVKVYKHAKDGIRETKKKLAPEDYYDEYGLSHPTNYVLKKAVKPPKGKERQEIYWYALRSDFNVRILKFCKWYSWYLQNDEKEVKK